MNAPRITIEAIEANIASEHYFTGGDGFVGNAWRTVSDGRVVTPPLPLELLTFCVLVLRNGFSVVGQSACADPRNFNAEIGRKIAREDAIDKVWPLMGYELKTHLAQEAA